MLDEPDSRTDDCRPVRVTETRAHHLGLMCPVDHVSRKGSNYPRHNHCPLRAPGQAEVLDYARRACEFAISAISAIGDDTLASVAKDDPDGDTYIDNILIYYERLSRHLGMIGAIRGLQGLSGTATR